MPRSLMSFKRRAALYVEKGEIHSGEALRLLYAPGASFAGVVFEKCLLDLATLNNATFSDCAFNGCSLIGANFRAAMLDNCTFKESEMAGVSFEGARLHGVGFSDCGMEGASFLGTIMQKPVAFVHSALTNADLRFYECEPGQPGFFESDLRGVVFAVNCEFWNATFDEKATADFGRVFARASRDADLVAMVKERWGADEYDKVDRYMRRD